MEKGQPLNSAGSANGTRADWAGAAREAVALATHSLSQLPEDEQFKLTAEFQSHFEAHEAQLVAKKVAMGSSDRRIGSLLGDRDKRSKRAASKTIRRGKAVNENPQLATKMKMGELSGEQSDLIAEASARTTGEAANDDEFIEAIERCNPDQGRKVVEDYVRKRMSQDDIDSKYERARRLRNVRRSSNPKRGTDVLEIEGAPADIDKIEARIDRLTNEIYKQDGGRDVPGHKHPRTYQQRRFDAFEQLITEDKVETSPDHKPVRRQKRSDRAVVFIGATFDQAAGKDASPLDVIGSDPLPRSLIDRLMCEAEFIGQIYDENGEIMRHGRRKRRHSPQQFEALVARDRCCVECSAHWSRCEVHHLLPWNAAIAGETDIENLVLLCGDCHHRVHALELTIERDVENQTWRTRRAKPEEIAPKRPNVRPRPRPNLRV